MRHWSHHQRMDPQEDLAPMQYLQPDLSLRPPHPHLDFLFPPRRPLLLVLSPLHLTHLLLLQHLYLPPGRSQQ